MSTESVVKLARVLPGAKLIDIDSINKVYRGQVLLADGTVEHAYIKDLDSWELASETMAAAICIQLELPTPSPFLAACTHGLLELTKAPVNTDNSRVMFASVDAQCPHVAFRYKAAPQEEKEGVIRKIAEWSEMAGLYYFDSWLANIDRHAGNLLLGALGQVWMIDHGLCFGGPDWSQGKLVKDQIYRNKIREWLSPRLRGDEKILVEQQAASFLERLKAINLHSTAKQNFVGAIIDENSVNELVNFLDQRIEEVTRIVSHALYPEHMV